MIHLIYLNLALFPIATPLNAWIFNRVDPTELFWQQWSLIGTDKYIRENVRLFNLGQQSPISFQNPPILARTQDEESFMYIHTFSVHGEYDDITDKQAGYMFSGVGSLRNRYLTGDFDEETLYSYRTDQTGTHGHFWQIWTVGFNSYQLHYGWQGDYCLTGTGKGDRLVFRKCNDADKNQLWSILET